MLWLILLSLSLMFSLLGTRLKADDEVYPLALYAAGLFSGLWGIAIAPEATQFTLGALTLGGIQLGSRR
ncbi:MAG: hypothetical protein HC800_24020 [Phormidesmis sp. RL_2_1]|nr:hypothetical protein [Phormidesmis sp. RL_2_1]